MELKLEAGKYYKTRDGRKAYVAGINPFSAFGGSYNVTGWINGCVSPESWSTDGTYYIGTTDRNDLIEEWKEPKKITVWVNVWKIKESGLICPISWLSESQSNKDIKTSDRSELELFARFSHTVEEGEGL